MELGSIAMDWLEGVGGAAAVWRRRRRRLTCAAHPIRVVFYCFLPFTVLKQEKLEAEHKSPVRKILGPTPAKAWIFVRNFGSKISLVGLFWWHSTRREHIFRGAHAARYGLRYYCRHWPRQRAWHGCLEAMSMTCAMGGR